MKNLFLKYKKLITDIFFTIGIGMIINVLAYLFNVMLGQKLPENSFGIYNAILGMIYLIQFPTVTVQSIITKTVALGQEKNLTLFTKNNLLRFAKVATVVSLLILAGIPILSSQMNINWIYFLPLLVIAFITILSSVPKGILYGQQKIKLVTFVLLLETIIRLIVGYIFAELSESPFFPILSFGIALGVSSLITYFLIDRNADKKDLFKEDIKISESFYMLITYFLLNTGYTLDIILINSENRADYAALALLGKIVFFASVIITSVMFSVVTNEKKKSERVKILGVSLVVNLALSLGVTLIFTLFNEEIVDIVFKGKYQVIIPYVTLMSLGMAMYSATFMLINFMLAIEKRIQIVTLSIISSMQILLYIFNNESLKDAVINQVIVYSSLFFSSLLIAFYTAIKSKRAHIKELLPPNALDPETLP